MHEIIYCLKKQLQQGANVRLTFKIGKILSRGGELSWSSLETFNGNATTSDYVDENGSRNSQFKVGSVFMKDLSVRTPAISSNRIRGSLSQGPYATNPDPDATWCSRSFNMANPNPQGTNIKFKGVRDVGYKKYQEFSDPNKEVIRFGKKVSYEHK